MPEDLFTRNYEFWISDRVRKCVFHLLNHKMKIKEFVSCLLLARRNKINIGYVTPRKDVYNKVSWRAVCQKQYKKNIPFTWGRREKLAFSKTSTKKQVFSFLWQVLFRHCSSGFLYCVVYNPVRYLVKQIKNVSHVFLVLSKECAVPNSLQF